jgi:colanic acid/amylovoran biosynthesis glycosyltransferase
MQPKVRLAYLTTRYPSLSHTFILREVAALRRRGVEVHTISMHGNSGDGEHLLSRENRDAAKSTYAVRPSRPRDVLSAHAGAFARHPLAYLRTFREALSLARPGVKGRPLWQVFYFGEAIIVWRHCAKIDVRHIHAHHGSAPSDVASLAVSFGRAVGIGPRTWSLTLHGPDELRDVRWFGLAEKVRRADAVACISDFARSQLMALVDDCHWAKLRVVHCGVAHSEFARLEPPRTARPQVLCVGRLVAEKGHAVLLNAVALLVEEGHDIEVVIVGSGPLQTRLERLARDLRVTDRVLFRGALGQDEVRRCYATASLFCSASFAEGVPVVLMEAMACGRPVVATAIAGVRELVRDGETGLLVTPGRPEELSRAIASLLRGPDLRARLVDAAREHVSREYDVDRSAGKLEELFSALLRPLDRRGQNSSRGVEQLATWTPRLPARAGELPLIPPTALDPRDASPPRPEPARSR